MSIVQFFDKVIIYEQLSFGTDINCRTISSIVIPAGENISAHRMVYLNDGKLFYANNVGYRNCMIYILDYINL